MRKQDLKTGMLVETEEMGVYFCVGEFLINEGGWTDINGFRDDLTDEDSDFNIIRVSKVLDGYLSLPKNWTSETITENLAWERKEPLPYNAWYKGALGSIVYFTGETSGWGISNSGAWLNNDQWQSLNSYNWTPATEEEVKEMLINYAKYKGYKNGNYKCLYHPNSTYDFTEEIVFLSNSWGVWIDAGGGRNLIFDSDTGKWAEIIKEEKLPEYTWDEIKEKLGHNFTIKEK